jgi:hypothetical protein
MAVGMLWCEDLDLYNLGDRDLSLVACPMLHPRVRETAGTFEH